MFTVFQISIALWLLAETVFQVRQYFQGGKAKTTEWTSLLVIVFSAFAGGYLGRLVGHAVPWLHIPVDTTVLMSAGLVPLWLGAGLRLWAIVTLGRYFRGVVHVQEDHSVVRTGPYRVIRHPAYTGALVGAFGISLLLANVASIAVLMACLCAGVLYRIRVEERVLLEGLGEAYATYASQTKRLVPGLW